MVTYEELLEMLLKSPPLMVEKLELMSTSPPWPPPMTETKALLLMLFRRPPLMTEKSSTAPMALMNTDPFQFVAPPPAITDPTEPDAMEFEGEPPIKFCPPVGVLDPDKVDASPNSTRNPRRPLTWSSRG